MSRSERGATRLLPWLLLGGAIIALLAVRNLERLRPEPLPTLGLVPHFQLTDQDGNELAEADLEGKVWIASFVYTSCPGPCPLMLQRARRLEREIDDDRLYWVAFSVDPANDSPARLREYARDRGLPPSSWRLATGPASEITELVRAGFSLVLAEAGDLEPEHTGLELGLHGPILHSTHLVLVDPDLTIRGYYDSTEPEALVALAHDARRLLAAQH